MINSGQRDKFLRSNQVCETRLLFRQVQHFMTHFLGCFFAQTGPRAEFDDACKHWSLRLI